MNWQPTIHREIPRRRRRKGLSGRARVIIAVIIIVALGWYLLGFLDDPEAPGQPPGQPRGQPPGQRLDQPATVRESGRAEQPLSGVIARETGPARAPAEDAGRQRPESPAVGSGAREGQEARAIIAQLGTDPGRDPLGRAHAEAEALLAAGRHADAYLLYFYAARQGHAPSALALGAMADPAQSSGGAGAAGGLDLFEAHKWYERAAALGDPTARQRLADLRRRVETAAAAGDPEAERLALQWR